MLAHDLASGPSTICVTPESVSMLADVAGLGSLIRDQELRLRWCDDSFASFCGLAREQLLGTTLRDILPAPIADERETLLRSVLDQKEPRSVIQFGDDKRLACRLIPIDSEAFGYAGVLCLITEAPLTQSTLLTGSIEILKTPYLTDLAALTTAELRTFYDVACGSSNNDTASRQFRSVRTIENHVESIHRKIGTVSRSALVRYATERGVHGFTPEQWDEIVQSAGETRKATASFSRASMDHVSRNACEN